MSPAPASSEQTLWTGTSSQLQNLGVYLLCLVLLGVAAAVWLGIGIFAQFAPYALIAVALAAVALLWALVSWMRVRSRRFDLTTERLMITQGILGKDTETLELYRVRDMKMTRSLMQRLFGLQSLHLITTDTSTPSLTLNHVPDSANLGDQFRAQVEHCRTRRGVREIDIE